MQLRLIEMCQAVPPPHWCNKTDHVNVPRKKSVVFVSMEINCYGDMFTQKTGHGAVNRHVVLNFTVHICGVSCLAT